MITHSAKETRQEKKQWGWVLEVTGKLGCEQNLKKGLGNRGGGGGGGGGFFIIGGQHSSANYVKTLKIPNPPIIKPTPFHSWLPPIPSRYFASPISTIFEKLHPPFMWDGGVRLLTKTKDIPGCFMLPHSFSFPLQMANCSTQGFFQFCKLKMLLTVLSLRILLTNLFQVIQQSCFKLVCCFLSNFYL